MKKIFILCALAAAFSVRLVQAQSYWTHVGPVKTPSTLYESGRLDVIVPAPNYNGTTNQVIYAGSVSGGLWSTLDDGGSWSLISTEFLKFSGVSDIVVDPITNNLYVSDVNVLNGYVRQSSGVYKYLTSMGVWQTTGTFPSSPLLVPGLKFKINHLKMHPTNNQIIFACTTGGIYRTINAGVTWTLVDYSAAFENIVFLPVSGGTYDVYASGDNKFKVSTSGGSSFTDVFTTNPFSFYDNFYSDCGYAYDNVSNTQIIYLFGKADKAAGITADYSSSSTTRGYVLYKFTRDAALVNGINYVLSYGDSDPNIDRLLVEGNKDVVYVGGDALRKYNFITNKFYFAGSNGFDAYIPLGGSSGYWGSIHNDLHDAKLIETGAIHRVMAATDGGYYCNDFTSNLNSEYTSSWQQKNQNMDISQIWGFSSSEAEPDYFSTGEADTKGFMFDRTDMSTCKTFGTEPSSTLIDKYNPNNIFFNSYQSSSNELLSTDHGVTFPSSGAYYNVLAGSTFIPDNTTSMSTLAPGNHFSQDINRPDKIYMRGSGLWQYSPINKLFGCKFRTGVWFTTSANPLLRDNWGTAINSIAVSPTNENKFYMAGSNSYAPSSTSFAGQVYSYSGANINDSWIGHNENSWSLITPDLRSVISSALTDNDIYQVNFKAIAVSDWDPDKIWLGIGQVPNFPQYKVLKREGGIWTDYSSGVPPDEEVVSLVYERGSNDGMYLGTNRTVYYRNASMLSWQVYENYIPHLFMVQMNINYKENTLRAGTFGRGIWKTQLNCPYGNKIVSACINCNSVSDYFWEGGYVSVSATTLNANKLIMRGTDYVEILPGSSYSLLNPVTPSNYYTAFIHGCSSGGNTFKIHQQSQSDLLGSEFLNEEEKESERIMLYPNPSAGLFNIRIPFAESKKILIYNVIGELVYEKENLQEEKYIIDLSGYPKGIYLVKVTYEGKTETVKLILE
ncbi:MAG: T9SS type A sorting domain-containing protein [Bacteroidetes bacterium]|nr:T9SS type A sorting domain-containing protein [Bacteroidota bacterium]